MAQVFLLPNGVGWWATALFFIPLVTTRLAYHRYVETRELFEQTIGRWPTRWTPAIGIPAVTRTG